MQFELKHFLIGIAVLAAVTMLLLQTIDFPRPQPATVERTQVALPSSVLKQLDARFETITPDMSESQVFTALGLKSYYYELKQHCWEQQDGAGGDWIHFIDKQGGYSLSMRSIMGNDPVKCWLTSPAHPDGRQKETGVLSPIEKRTLQMESESQW